MACFANAERLIGDAKALTRRGSHGHAIALLVLAEEELGKAFFFDLQTFGIEIPEFIVRSHQAKQLAKVLIFDLMDLLLFDLLEKLMRASAEPDESVRARRTSTALERVKRKWSETDPKEFATKFESELERLLDMEQAKESGLYVDIKRNGISSPESFSEVQARRHLKLVQRRYARFRRLFSFQQYATEAQLVDARKQWEGHRGAVDKDLGRMLGLFVEVAKGGLSPEALSKLGTER